MGTATTIQDAGFLGAYLVTPGGLIHRQVSFSRFVTK